MSCVYAKFCAPQDIRPLLPDRLHSKPTTTTAHYYHPYPFPLSAIAAHQLEFFSVLNPAAISNTVYTQTGRCSRSELTNQCSSMPLSDLSDEIIPRILSFVDHQDVKSATQIEVLQRPVTHILVVWKLVPSCRWNCGLGKLQ